MTPLAETIRTLIKTKGPMSVAEYMSLCLGDDNRGYYITRNPIGAQGDFITSPEISQVFGDLLGLWAATIWDTLGRPSAIRLVELGPGRGTLLADALRATKNLTAFMMAVDVHLVETSPILRQAQLRTLADCGAPRAWHSSIDTVPGGPAIFIANEFFDALPVRQFVRTPGGWRERMVGLDGDTFVFTLGGQVETTHIPAALHDSPEGTLVEVAQESARIMEKLGRRLARQGGAAIVIDYGHVRTAAGETLQAVREHAFADPLRHPGSTDLTAHVDFEALAAAARCGGAEVHGPLTQRDLLLRLGAAQRTEKLKKVTGPSQRSLLDSGLARLTDPAPAGMGRLFKAIAITKPGTGVPPPFGLPPSRVKEGAAQTVKAAE